MDYYDIHTHNKDITENAVAIYNNPIFEKIPRSDEPCRLYFSVGIHPWHISPLSDMVEHLGWLEQELRTNKLIKAVGECGLDKLKYPNADINKQIEIFQSQIYLSEKYEKPLIIHCVKAYQELIDIYQDKKPTQPWIIHGFRGNPAFANQLCRLGFNLSFGYLFNEKTPASIPQNKIFLETDEADCSIETVYQRIAESMKIPIEKLKNIIEKNIRDLSFI